MATQTVTVARPNDSRLLHRTLRGNAIFSIISGAACLADSGPIGAFLGLGSAAPIAILGAVLLVYAAILLWDTARAPISRRTAWIAIALDIDWVIGSILLVAFDPVGLTLAGKWAILILADLVLAFAVAQYVGLRRARSSGATR
jgi:hypothetical protein